MKLTTIEHLPPPPNHRLNDKFINDENYHHQYALHGFIDPDTKTPKIDKADKTTASLTLAICDGTTLSTKTTLHPWLH